jgi:hypothetical protein
VKILLDECVPSPLRKLLVGHECHTAQEMGWKSIKNGDLLALAEDKFDLFITADQGLAYEQNLRSAASRFSNSRLTSSVQSKLLPHNCTMPSRLCPAESFVVLKFLCRIAAV